MAMNPLAALLGGHGGPPPGHPQSIQVPAPSGPGPGQMISQLAAKSKVTVDTVISDLHSLAGQTDDQQDKATILKCLSAIQGIKATEQKEKEAAMGTTPTHRFMAKQSAGQSY